MTFASDLQRFADKAGKNIDQVRKGVAVDIFSKVILRSPVGDPSQWKTKYKPKGYIGGTFRGNWQTTVNTPSVGSINNIDPSGSSSIAEAVRMVNSAQGDQAIWFVNNLPYAYRLEYESWSDQAPNGMVRLSVAEFRQALRAQLRAIKK